MQFYYEKLNCNVSVFQPPQVSLQEERPSSSTSERGCAGRGEVYDVCMNTLRIGGSALLLIVVGILGAFATPAHAAHTWGPYHWARKANPFTLKLGDNVTSSWDAYLLAAAADWNTSSVLDVSIVYGGKNPKTCRPSYGRGDVCNAKYGFNGWLGIAQIWVSGDHITQGTVKVNDTYFTTSSYNTPEWKTLVMCQEVGHIFGLGHQDENIDNADLGTCMDYTRNPSANQHPNAHDYSMLETMYAHLDTTTTLSQATASKGQDIDTNNPREWGRELRRSADGRTSLFARDLGNGEQVFTHVFWVENADEDRFTRVR